LQIGPRGRRAKRSEADHDLQYRCLDFRHRLIPGLELRFVDGLAKQASSRGNPVESVKLS